MSNAYLKIPIHVKPYVKKFIVANYGESIPLTLTDPDSIMLYSLLQKQNIPFRMNDRALEKRFQKLTEIVHLRINRIDRYKHGVLIRQKNQLMINNYFEQEIQKLIFQQCQAYAKAQAVSIAAFQFSTNEAYTAKLQLSREKAIEDFCELYGIELHKDISLEAICKAEYRDRLQKKNIKNMGRICPLPKNQPVPVTTNS